MNSGDVVIVAVDTTTANGIKTLGAWLNASDVAKVQGRRYVGGMVPPNNSKRCFIFAVDTERALIGMVVYCTDLAAHFAQPSTSGVLGAWTTYRLRGLTDTVRQHINAALDQFASDTLAAMPAQGAA